MKNGKLTPKTVQQFTDTAQPFFCQGDDTGCLVLHGFTGTPANVRVIADALRAAGHTVYAPLLSGHGTSLADMDMQRAGNWRRDAERGYDRLKRAGCRRIFVIGHSMGGTLALLMAQGREVAGVALICTPLKLKPYLSLSGPLGLVKPYLMGDLTASYEDNPYAQGYAGTPLRRLADVRLLMAAAQRGLSKVTCPLLIIQSRKDKRISLKSVGMIQRGVKSRDVGTVYLEHSNHGAPYEQERDDVAARCAAFVEANTVKKDGAKMPA